MPDKDPKEEFAFRRGDNMQVSSRFCSQEQKSQPSNLRPFSIDFGSKDKLMTIQETRACQIKFPLLFQRNSQVLFVQFLVFIFLGANCSVCKIFLAEVLSRHLLIFSLMKLVTLERVKIDSLPQLLQERLGLGWKISCSSNVIQ